MRFSDIHEDGTYMVDAHGDLHHMEYSTGYMVGIREIQPEEIQGDIPKLTLVGKWTDARTFRTYWDEVEVIDNLLDAGNIARQRGELAIWDNFNGKEIRV